MVRVVNALLIISFKDHDDKWPISSGMATRSRLLSLVVVGFVTKILFQRHPMIPKQTADEKRKGEAVLFV